MKKFTIILLIFSGLQASPQTGISWSPPGEVATSMYDNLHPRVAMGANGNPMVIWGRMSNKSVYVSRWDGTAFTMPEKLNPFPLEVAVASWQGPQVAAKGDTVYVVMKQIPESDDSSHIYLVRSTDGGVTFTTPIRVSFIADSVSRFAVVAIDDAGNPIVAFMKFNPGFGNARWVAAKSTDMGNTFSTDVPASGWSGGTVCDCCPGGLAVSGSNAVMLYRDNLSDIRDTWIGISNDGGASFTQGLNVDGGNWMIAACPSTGPDGIIIGDTLYSTFMSASSGKSLVYLNRTSLVTAALSPRVPVKEDFAGLLAQNYPRIANAGNSVALAWKETVSGDNQLLLRFAADITSGFPASADTVAPDNVTNCDVALSAGSIFVVWEDDISGTVKYRKGTFSGTGLESRSCEGAFSLSPNPSTGRIHLKLDCGGKASVSVTDMLGRQVHWGQVDGRCQLDMPGWSGGMYFVTVRVGGSSSTRKVWKLE